MISGEYPCCGEPLCIAIPDLTPAYMPEDCPSCGAKVWHRLSRFYPQSWLEAAFLELYEVDQDARTIRERNPPEPMSWMTRWVLDLLAQDVAQAYADALILGTGEPDPLYAGILPGRSVIETVSDEMQRITKQITTFNSGSVKVYRVSEIGSELIGTVGELGLTDELDPLWPQKHLPLGDQVSVMMSGEALSAFGYASFDITLPPEPFHYSQLNPVSRNARRGRKRRRKCR